MINDARAAFLAWCRSERDINEKIVQRLTSPGVRVRTYDDGVWKDTTDESVANSRRILADMADLIPKIEADIAKGT